MKLTNFRRWSDSQVQFWPFTVAWNGDGMHWTGIELHSGHDEHPGCHIRFYLIWITVLIELPWFLLLPVRHKITAGWDAATVSRLGRDWYYQEWDRVFGFCYSGHGFLQVFHGAQTHSSDTTKSKGYFFPFMEWRHVRQSWYGLQGEHLVTLFDSAFQASVTHRPLGEKFRWQQIFEDQAPRVRFDFRDYDGELIQATSFIEEREWRRGIGAFKWLSWFSAPRISRSLALKFSSEVGHQKGSWKGGTIGHAIDLCPGELHEAGFRRYCAEQGLTFIGLAGAAPLA